MKSNSKRVHNLDVRCVFVTATCLPSLSPFLNAPPLKPICFGSITPLPTLLLVAFNSMIDVRLLPPSSWHSPRPTSSR